MSVKIKNVDCVHEIDPYHRDTQGFTITTLHIDPESRTCSINQEYDDNATPSRVWHGVDIERNIEPGVYDGGQIEAYLNSREGQALLDRVCDGHEVEWDGSNHVGRMDDDAESALDELVEEIMSYPSDREEWTCDGWFGNNSDDELGITAQTTDAEIKALAEKYEREADAVLIDDVESYLRSRRDDAKVTESE